MQSWEVLTRGTVYHLACVEHLTVYYNVLLLLPPLCLKPLLINMLSFFNITMYYSKICILFNGSFCLDVSFFLFELSLEGFKTVCCGCRVFSFFPASSKIRYSYRLHLLSSYISKIQLICDCRTGSEILSSLCFNNPVYRSSFQQSDP